MLDVHRLAAELQARGARVVAIDGCGGAGKSTLARQLVASLPAAAVVAMDDFYRPADGQRGAPSAHGGSYDIPRLIAEVLEPLAAAKPGLYRRYDWESDRLAEWRDVPAAATVVLEGVYSTSAALRSFIDYAIWVQAPRSARLRRGIERDGEQARSRWETEWMPAEERYIAGEHPDERAELVVDGAAGAAGGFLVLRRGD
ncbi:MAG TPA: hypothetical protein VMA83_06410 [Solirubrobacteraceae bacterium]|nr:hypothetical protein [Solirubrobacteraceae bacterium]